MQSVISQMLLARHKLRKVDELKYIVIHRTLGETVEESLAEFRKTEKFDAGWYTGGLYPYHFFVDPVRVVTQCLPISRIGPAALRTLNETGIHVAAAGDFRKRPPTPAQEAALTALVASLSTCYNDALDIIGHTERADLAALKNSKDPSKVCPGKFLDIVKLRMAVYGDPSNLCELAPSDGLRRAGIVV